MSDDQALFRPLNTTADKHEVDDITTFIERKSNDLSQIMEKKAP